MADPLALISTRNTPQTERADSRQEKNHAGGYTFVPDDLARLHRFLTLGSTGGTYYASEAEHTKENAQLVLDLARSRTLDVVNAVVEISTSGRAPKQNPALFALAAAAKLGDDEGRKAALAAVPLVARTGTHLFILAGYLEQFGGWGRGTRRAIANWYLDRDVDDVAYQAAKYRQREGWTHGDLLRLSHPKPVDADPQAPGKRQLFNWILGRETDLSGLAILDAFQRAEAATSPEQITALVTGRGLSWEMIPDRFLNEPMVWESLIAKGLPQTALMRQLPRLTRLGLLSPFGAFTPKVVAQLQDPERLKKARVHPINVLVAQRTYASGQSARGDSTWSPSRPIVDALDAAFYAAYGAVQPTGKRMLLALDASGSMTGSVSGLPLTCREAAAALALVTANVESAYELVAFTADQYARQQVRYDGSGQAWGGSMSLLREHSELTPLGISPRQRLDDVLKTVAALPWSGTDCALPMVHALRAGLKVDTFVVLTDNDTWHGSIHPHQALEQYRRETGIDAKLVVVSMTANGATIANPSDPGMLDVSGFDSAVPGLISDFARGF